jgi:hypothetical protein
MRRLIHQYLEHLHGERQASPNTIRKYEEALVRFAEFLGREFLGKDPDAVRPEEVDAMAVRSFLAALTRDEEGRLVQPGIKCRGREYLRIIYGPEYTRPDNLTRLRGRFLNHKRSLAIREYVLGLESLDRLAEGEPLWRVHEAVFGVLALESEPVDPRL